MNTHLHSSPEGFRMIRPPRCMLNESGITARNMSTDLLGSRGIVEMFGLNSCRVEVSTRFPQVRRKILDQHKNKPDSCKNSNMSPLTSLTDFFEWLQQSEMLYWNLIVPTNEHLPPLFSFSPFFPSSLYFTSLSWTVSSMHPPPPPQYHYIITPPILHTHTFTHRFQDQRS